MKAFIATALLGPSDDSSKDQELDINRMYFDVVSGGKKQCVYGLGSQASTLYKEKNSVNSASLVSDHVAEERIKTLEKEVSQMIENLERVLQERVATKVQQRVEQELFRLRKQSDDRFKSMEELWSRMMSDMAISSLSFSNSTLPNRDSSNA
ncbi:putative L-aspartate oxidase, chloroplastic-like [Capsicum annuum]|nr:putative L-aspartate oxidase, chloroplastic-like [Capsicum annuum]KAF3667772.1 putative L-aspartate oxidase, chloroplastic-like [Capsicum annuum]